jgi:hypothetical protein
MDCKIGVIEGRHFVVRTDNHALSFLFSGSQMSDILCRYLEFFQQFDFEVEWVLGASNIHAAFFSRFPCDGSCVQCRGTPERARVSSNDEHAGRR